jgi:hypothetical protein
VAGVRLHPRYAIAKAAELQISKAIGDAVTEHDLTYAEVLLILTGELKLWATYLLRTERHPDNPERKADEE